MFYKILIVVIVSLAAIILTVITSVNFARNKNYIEKKCQVTKHPPLVEKLCFKECPAVGYSNCISYSYFCYDAYITVDVLDTEIKNVNILVDYEDDQVDAKNSQNKYPVDDIVDCYVETDNRKNIKLDKFLVKSIFIASIVMWVVFSVVVTLFFIIFYKNRNNYVMLN